MGRTRELRAPPPLPRARSPSQPRPPLTRPPSPRSGYDLPLTSSVRAAVSIPVIASSGAGAPAHFTEVFEVCGVEAALAASIFHRNLVSIADVKADLHKSGVGYRPTP